MGSLNRCKIRLGRRKMVIGLLGARGEGRLFMDGSQVGKKRRGTGLMEVRRRRFRRRQDVSNGDVVI